MGQSGGIKDYLVDLWHPNLRLGKQVPAAEKPDGRLGPIFKLTGWRGAGWRMIFLDEPAK